MNFTPGQASLYLQRLSNRVQASRDIQVILAPSTISLQPLSLQINRRQFKLAAQNFAPSLAKLPFRKFVALSITPLLVIPSVAIFSTKAKKTFAKRSPPPSVMASHQFFASAKPHSSVKTAKPNPPSLPNFTKACLMLVLRISIKSLSPTNQFGLFQATKTLNQPNRQTSPRRKSSFANRFPASTVKKLARTSPCSMVDPSMQTLPPAISKFQVSMAS